MRDSCGDSEPCYMCQIVGEVLRPYFVQACLLAILMSLAHAGMYSWAGRQPSTGFASTTCSVWMPKANFLGSNQVHTLYKPCEPPPSETGVP